MQHEVLKGISTAYEAYLQDEKGLAASSRRSYLAAMRGFVSLCSASPRAFFLPPEWDWRDLDKRAVEIYLNALRQQRGWKPASVAQHASALRAFFDFLERRGHLERNPARSLTPRVPPGRLPLPDGEEAAVLRLFERTADTLTDTRLLLLLELLYGGGLRPGQAYGVQRLTIQPRRSTVRLRTDAEELEVVLAAAGLQRARDYLEQRRETLGSRERGPFWVDRRGQPCPPARLAREVSRAMERAGLEGGPSSLRKLAARHFKARGGDMRSLRRFIGAKRLGELDRYGPPDFQEVLRQFRRIHPRQQER